MISANLRRREIQAHAQRPQKQARAREALSLQGSTAGGMPYRFAQAASRGKSRAKEK